MARPTEYSQEVEDQAWEYVENYAEHDHAIPSVVGLCKIINRARSTVYKWAEEEDKQFSDILCAIKESQELSLVSKGLSGDFNPAITKLMLTKHGYSDKQQTELTGADGGPIQTDSVFEFIPVDSDS